MTTDRWDQIRGLDGWQRKLQELLDAATQVAANDDLSQRLGVHRRLSDFIANSPDTIDGVGDLDIIARSAMRQLLLATVSERLGGISDRTADLALLTKQFSRAAADARTAASSIRLERAKRVVDGSTQLIADLSALRESVGQLEDDPDKVAERIERVISAVQTLRTEVEKIV